MHTVTATLTTNRLMSTILRFNAFVVWQVFVTQLIICNRWFNNIRRALSAVLLYNACLCLSLSACTCVRSSEWVSGYANCDRQTMGSTFTHQSHFMATQYFFTFYFVLLYHQTLNRLKFIQQRKQHKQCSATFLKIFQTDCKLIATDWPHHLWPNKTVAWFFIQFVYRDICRLMIFSFRIKTRIDDQMITDPILVIALY